MVFLDEPPQRQERAPSPPPAYDEVTKAAQVDASISDVKIDFGNESPPDYEIALAMCRAERQTNSDYLTNQVRINMIHFFEKVFPHLPLYGVKLP